MIYPLFYNAPVSYFAHLVREKEVHLEKHDHYTKQTYRNRCRILGPNGVMTLSIPVKRMRGIRNLYRDVRIDYDKPWNKIHWKSLVASYGSSPFFEYLRDDLAPFYEVRHEFLADLNWQLLEKTIEIMGLDIPVSPTGSFDEITGPGDPRHFIHPKLDMEKADPAFRPVAYHQVFLEKHGFRSELSILDLLFNEGPGSLTVLKRSLAG